LIEPQPLEIRLERRGDVTFVELFGEFDLAEKQRFESAIAPLASGTDSPGLVIDLRGLTFMDSTGLRCLLEVSEKSRELGFELKVVNGTGPVRRVLSLTGIDSILPMCDAAEVPSHGSRTESDALAA
jgi:anti-sigma B factor antagonist